jgi:NAD(P)-dependent dehydrogenase (short-subunit alcohol dehydrogenase family)
MGYPHVMADGESERSPRPRGVAVISGASAGVGRATARVLARRGWSLGLLARGRTGLDAARTEAEDAGVPAVAMPTAVSDHAAVEAAADEIERQLGPIDAWVNDAMAGVFGRFLDVPTEDFRRVTEVTYLGYVHGTRAALERMLPRDRGVIVQVGSALAYRGIPLQSAYCGAKHAVHGFTESVRAELHHERSSVRICEVQLPALNTPQFRWVKALLPHEPQPVPPIYQPEVAADAIAWTVEHPRREVWVGSSTVFTVIANRIVPGLLDRYLGWTGIRSQQSDEPLDLRRLDNLYEPVEDDRGAHGVFDARSAAHSPQLWASKHRRALAVAIGVIGGVGVAAASSARARDDGS